MFDSYYLSFSGEYYHYVYTLVKLAKSRYFLLSFVCLLYIVFVCLNCLFVFLIFCYHLWWIKMFTKIPFGLTKQHIVESQGGRVVGPYCVCVVRTYCLNPTAKQWLYATAMSFCVSVCLSVANAYWWRGLIVLAIWTRSSRWWSLSSSHD